MNGKKQIPVLTPSNCAEVLQMLYEKKIAPMERHHLFDQFVSPVLTKADFTAKPMVMLLGQHSSGKTSMVKHLVGDEYPGSFIGSGPTTDCFVAIQYGDVRRETMGAALVMDGSMPFDRLHSAGATFLSKLRGATLPSPLLKHVTLLDTPGVLAEQNRGYDFHSAVHFFASKVDMIVVMFDTSNLDINDEYKKVLQNLKESEDKIRILLNKADSVSPSDLLRSRGALMWNLSKILSSVEVPRVFIGAFGRENNGGNQHMIDLFAADYEELIGEIQQLAVSASISRIDHLIKRVKSLKVHALFMDAIIQRGTFGSTRDVQKKKALPRLTEILEEVGKKHELVDLPNPCVFQRRAGKSSLDQWRKIEPKMMAHLESFLNDDIGKILAQLPTKKSIPGDLKEWFNSLMAKQGAKVTSTTNQEPTGASLTLAD
ncbi:hypothetical protein QR680_006989 [Steinernema hermaphroditum]|uniref:Dynamin-type G domain-containing protein n=1 Tax=Steinernema hermaphroditum TaxID=289476 RepID=A0AA39HXB0_9BILA|nr:hypothetical protein QR680_006989 [Steinernema hermaphroditum]